MCVCGLVHNKPEVGYGYMYVRAISKSEPVSIKFEICISGSYFLSFPNILVMEFILRCAEINPIWTHSTQMAPNKI